MPLKLSLSICDPGAEAYLKHDSDTRPGPLRLFHIPCLSVMLELSLGKKKEKKKKKFGAVSLCKASLRTADRLPGSEPTVSERRVYLCIGDITVRRRWVGGGEDGEKEENGEKNTQEE